MRRSSYASGPVCTVVRHIAGRIGLVVRLPIPVPLLDQPRLLAGLAVEELHAAAEREEYRDEKRQRARVLEDTRAVVGAGALQVARHLKVENRARAQPLDVGLVG